MRPMPVFSVWRWGAQSVATAFRKVDGPPGCLVALRGWAELRGVCQIMFVLRSHFAVLFWSAPRTSRAAHSGMAFGAPLGCSLFRWV